MDYLPMLRECDREAIERQYENIKKYTETVFNRKSLNADQFIEAYNCVYHFCQLKVKAVESQRTLGILELCDILFRKSEEDFMHHIKKYLNTIVKCCGIKMLHTYANLWNHLQYTAVVLTDMFGYVHANWIRKQYMAPDNTMISIAQIFKLSWRSAFCETILPKATVIIDDLLKKSREGETVDLSCLLVFVKSFYQIENIVFDSPVTECPFYVEGFENHLIDDISGYYSENANTFLRYNTFANFTKQARDWIDQENRRIAQFSPHSTKKKVRQLLNKILVSQYLDRYFEALENSLQMQNHDLIQIIFQLLSFDNQYTDQVLAMFRVYLERYTEMRFTEQMALTPNPEPSEYVEFLSNYAESTNFMDGKYFDCKREFSETIASITMRNINSNTFTQKCETTTSEYIAKFLDIILKNKAKQIDGTDFELSTNRALKLFMFLEEKDVFQKFYSKYLAKRLINATAMTMDVESWALSKIKDLAGFEFCFKLEKMFNDVNLSKIYMEQYAHMTQNINFEFTSLVLTRSVWPVSLTDAIILPVEAAAAAKQFVDLYTGNNANKKLVWVHNLAKTEVSTNCFKNAYTIQMSTYQMCILFLYNDYDSLNVEQICNMTKIPIILIQQILVIFIKTRLLNSSISPDENGSNLVDNITISYNPKYNNKKLKFNINVPLKYDIDLERESAKKEIQLDRSFEIQACIVRIMKTRKVLVHSQLIAEVIQQLSHRFKPDISLVKRNIDTLIDREYLERDESDGNSYKYLA